MGNSSSHQKAPLASPQCSLWICFAPGNFLDHEISGALNFIDCFYDCNFAISLKV